MQKQEQVEDRRADQLEESDEKMDQLSIALKAATQEVAALRERNEQLKGETESDLVKIKILRETLRLLEETEKVLEGEDESMQEGGVGAEVASPQSPTSSTSTSSAKMWRSARRTSVSAGGRSWPAVVTTTVDKSKTEGQVVVSITKGSASPSQSVGRGRLGSLAENAPARNISFQSPATAPRGNGEESKAGPTHDEEFVAPCVVASDIKQLLLLVLEQPVAQAAQAAQDLERRRQAALYDRELARSIRTRKKEEGDADGASSAGAGAGGGKKANKVHPMDGPPQKTRAQPPRGVGAQVYCVAAAGEPKSWSAGAAMSVKGGYCKAYPRPIPPRGAPRFEAV